jgi:hypothetical protein
LAGGHPFQLPRLGFFATSLFPPPPPRGFYSTINATAATIEIEQFRFTIIVMIVSRISFTGNSKFSVNGENGKIMKINKNQYTPRKKRG